MVMPKDAVVLAGGFSPSVTCTVKLEAAGDEVGVPLMLPVVGLSCRPLGRLPEEMLQE